MKKLLLLLSLVAGCGEAEPTFPSPPASVNELHWLGKVWSEPKVELSEGVGIYEYKLSEWPGVKVQVMRGSDHYVIKTFCWSNDRQDYVEHGPSLLAGSEGTRSSLEDASGSSSGAVVVPWINNPVRVDDPSKY